MKDLVDRRRFLAAGLAATGLAVPARAAGRPDEEKEAGEEGKKALVRPIPPALRVLGRTGIRVFEIGLGTSPVPPEPVFRKALDLGVNYLDTSQSYMNGNSERLIGKVLRGRRDRVVVTTKFHGGRRRRKTRREIEADLDASLKRLNTDYVDGFLLHGVSRPEQLEDEDVLAAFETFKKKGKIRFCGASCHRDPAGVLLPAIRSGRFDLFTVAFSAYSTEGFDEKKVYDHLLAASGIETVLAEARKRKVAIVAMKTMGGGDRQNLAPFRGKGVTPAQAKLRWALSHPAVCCAITEMPTFEILEENLAVAGRKPLPGEKEALKEYVRATSRETCRFCGACLPACRQGIPVPDLLRYIAYYEGYGKKDAARAAYRALPAERNASACRACGRCEDACPYGVTVRAVLGRARAKLG